LRLHKSIAAFSGLMLAGAALAAEMTDDAVRECIVRDSVAAYPGNCPCPYNTDRAGRSCGGRSAWSRGGGYSPICYAREVTDEQVRDFRKRH
jgi:hypothetical protein